MLITMVCLGVNYCDHIDHVYIIRWFEHVLQLQEERHINIIVQIVEHIPLNKYR